MLDPQTFEIQIEGLEQKTDHKVLKAGKLTRANNVEFDKGGSIRKRRGYRRLMLTSLAAFGQTMETQIVRVADHNDELLLFGVGWLWSVGSKTSSIDGRAVVRRGRIANGNLRVWDIASASEEAA